MHDQKLQLGMWHRPFERNLEEVQQTLKELKTYGIKDLFVETYFNGQLIYNSQICLLPKHHFVGTYGMYEDDLLKAFIMEGKKEGIRIHAWVENFFVGRFDQIEETYWYEQKKTWILINRDQTFLQKNEVNYLFLDPANEDVRNYVFSLYEEMIRLHQGLESLHLDYIRYPLVYDITPPKIQDDVGYTKVALDTFIRQHKLDGHIYDLLTDAHIYRLWCAFKMGIINTFVEKIYRLSQSKTKLSIAIFGDPKHAQKHKMQDWSAWIEKNMIDLIIPMAYYKDEKRVFEEVSKLYQYVDGRAKVYAGIAPAYIGCDTDAHYKQLMASKDAKAEGVVMFATQNYLTKHFMGETNDRKDINLMFKAFMEEGKTNEQMD